MHADPVASRSSLLGNQVLSLAAPSPAAASPHTPPQQLAAPDSHLSMRRSYGMSVGFHATLYVNCTSALSASLMSTVLLGSGAGGGWVGGLGGVTGPAGILLHRQLYYNACPPAVSAPTAACLYHLASPNQPTHRTDEQRPHPWRCPPG